MPNINHGNKPKENRTMGSNGQQTTPERSGPRKMKPVPQPKQKPEQEQKAQKGWVINAKDKEGNPIQFMDPAGAPFKTKKSAQAYLDTNPGTDGDDLEGATITKVGE